MLSLLKNEYLTPYGRLGAEVDFTCRRLFLLRRDPHQCAIVFRPRPLLLLKRREAFFCHVCRTHAIAIVLRLHIRISAALVLVTRAWNPTSPPPPPPPSLPPHPSSSSSCCVAFACLSSRSRRLLGEVAIAAAIFSLCANRALVLNVPRVLTRYTDEHNTYGSWLAGCRCILVIASCSGGRRCCAAHGLGTGGRRK